MDIGHFLLAGAILLAVTGATLLVAQRMHVGSIVALLAAGVLVGPHSPYPLLQGSNDALDAVGQVGVMLLIFVVALDVRPSRLWSSRLEIVALGTTQYFGSTLMIGALLLAATGAGWQMALVIGLAAAMSSSAIAFPMLAKTGGALTPHGGAVIAVDVFQSFMVPVVLIGIPLLAHDATASRPASTFALEAVLAVAAVAVLVLVLMPFVLRRAARDLGTGSFTLLVLSGVLLAAWITDAAGLSAAAGAFAAGVLLSTSVFATQIKAVVTPARKVFLALFFLSIGMALDPAQLVSMRVELALFLPGIFAVKLAITYAAARFFRLAPRDALLTSLLLMPLDEIAYVFFASARHGGLLDARGYAISLAVISTSFVVAPLAINLGIRLAPRARGPLALPAPVETAGPAGTASAPAVVLMGYGNLGRELCALLEAAHVDYLCIDGSLDNVAHAARRGHRVRFAHVDDPGTLDALGIADARLVAVAHENLDYAKRVLQLLRDFHPGTQVRVAVPFLAQRDELRALGFEQAFAVVPEGALIFGRSMLDALGVEPKRADQVIESLRSGDYAALRPPRP